MKHTRHLRFLQAGWIILLLLLLLMLMVTPVSANRRVARPSTAQTNPATAVAASVYITLGTVEPIFQSNINNAVPGAVNTAINGIVNSLPQQDRSWAQIMATTLFQPSATLTGLTRQSNGLLASLRLSLYSGDPHPISASLLTSFNVSSASTITVTARPVSGSPTLVNGPVSTFQIPFGKLNSIKTMTTCGDATLNIGLQFPLTLGQGQTQSQVQLGGLSDPANPATLMQMQHPRNLVLKQNDPATDQNSYIEIPATSIATIGSSIGSFPVNSSQTAKNIQVSVQGNQLVVTSDIYDSFWGHIGSAVTTMAPTTANGNIAVKVLSTTFKLFGFISIPYDSYDQQIQQSLNQKLQGALAGKFNVTSAQIGPDAQLPCAASNSLLLTGTASLG